MEEGLILSVDVDTTLLWEILCEVSFGLLVQVGTALTQTTVHTPR